MRPKNRDAHLLLVVLDSSWDPSLCVVSQDTFAVQTSKGSCKDGGFVLTPVKPDKAPAWKTDVLISECL